MSALVLRRSFSHLVESDDLFKWRANLRQGLIDHAAQALAWLAPATPVEEEEHGQGDAYKSRQRRCRCVPALHARRLARVKVPRAIGDVADSAVRPGGPWLAQLAICIRARRLVGRGRIGTTPQIRAGMPSSVRQYPGSKGSRARVDPEPLHSDPIGHGLQDTLPAAGSVS